MITQLLQIRPDCLILRKPFVLLTIVLSSVNYTNGQIIDDFKGGAFSLSSGNGNLYEMSTGIGHSMGDRRTVYMYDPIFLLKSTLTIDPAVGKLTYECSQSGGMQLRYGMTLNFNDWSTYIDLSQGTGFSFKIDAPVGATMGINLTDAFRNAADLIVRPEISQGGTWTVPFSAFTESYGGFNWHYVSSLIFKLDNNPIGTYSISEISVIPEPSEYATGVSLILAAFALGRNWRKSSLN